MNSILTLSRTLRAKPYALVGLLCTVGWLTPAVAAPGEDPVVLRGPVQYLSLPLGSGAKSQGLETLSEMPSSLRAKVARYTAKAYSADTSGIATDNDVVTTVSNDGFRKTCVQEVGSNTAAQTPFNNYGPGKQDQVVVLRGDLINACR
ncbi:MULTISPECIES: hypothetical protein [unclassified Acidovorax]|uniref:hypothetical protein n=1 Tax=unclassified Acidovorax TaxID=2684926 RepID=UPI002882F54D|nr:MULTISPECIES: hypothetical protein [unclassified Acidovorax]